MLSIIHELHFSWQKEQTKPFFSGEIYRKFSIATSQKLVWQSGFNGVS
jgi:hypothetical protein